MAFEIDSFLAREIARCKPALPASLVQDGKMEFAEWQAALRERLHEIVGPFPAAPVDLQLEVLGEEALDGVRRLSVAYQSQEGLTVPAYYLIPEHPLPGRPAVIAAGGHSFGVDDIVGIGEDGGNYPDVQSAGYQKQFALTLAQRGFHVIAPELIGFGQLRLAEDKGKGPHFSSCQPLSTSLLMCGSTTTSVRVYECVRCLDVLAELGDANPGRVGCMGISGGGLVCTFLAALEQRIRACVVSGYANTFKTAALAVHSHCVDNFFFDMLRLCELPDILSLVAPRPMLWEMGTEDPLFPVEAGRNAAAEVRRLYRLFDAEELFLLDVFEGPHEISGARSYDFLAANLMKV